LASLLIDLSVAKAWASLLISWSVAKAWTGLAAC
jgi:hypothetical protein